MNETGSYPGQPWLWRYTPWYQAAGVRSSAKLNLIAVYLTGAATLMLLAVAFLPGLGDIPRLVPGDRLIWRDWYGGSQRNQRPQYMDRPGGPTARAADAPKPWSGVDR